MIDEIEIVISKTDSFDKVCYSNTDISQLETVYKPTLVHFNIHQKEEKWEKKMFSSFL